MRFEGVFEFTVNAYFGYEDDSVNLRNRKPQEGLGTVVEMTVPYKR